MKWGDVMQSEVFVALLSFLGTLAGTVGGIITSAKLTNYRLRELEKKVDKHNHLVERTYHLEEAITLAKEQIKVANHRIEDLEKKEVM